MSNYVLKQPSKPVKVVSVQGDGTYTNKQGEIQYKFAFSFSDGVNMSASYSENSCPHKEGDEVIYTVNWANDKGALGSVRSAQEKKKNYPSKGGGWKPKTLIEMKHEKLTSNPSWALAYAKDFHTANGTDPSAGRAHEVITETADHFLAWLDEKTHQVQEIPKSNA